MKFILLPALLFALSAVACRAQEVGAPLEITTEKTLPKAILATTYETRLVATGGLPPRNWEIVAGKLPPGLNLDPVTGTISGTATAMGEFRFAVEVSDSDDPPETRSREFALRVISALTLEWKRPPTVTPDGLAGAIKLANQTRNDVDLTMIVVAVNEIGKAFVLGYQHFTFPAQTTMQEIAFGSGLPRGTYLVHADVIAEVAGKNSIYRARLQTADPLATH